MKNKQNTPQKKNNSKQTVHCTTTRHAHNLSSILNVEYIDGESATLFTSNRSIFVVTNILQVSQQPFPQTNYC